MTPDEKKAKAEEAMLAHIKKAMQFTFRDLFQVGNKAVGEPPLADFAYRLADKLLQRERRAGRIKLVAPQYVEPIMNTSNDRTIRELQSSLPWTGHYHRDFRATPMTHKDLAHALLHIHKAGGKLAAIVNDAEHGGVDWASAEVRKEVGKYLADFVICALRAANTCPDGIIDLQRAVEDRIEGKNNQLAAQALPLRAVERAG